IYTPTTLAGNTSTHVHVVSQTSASSCKTYANTASFSSSNAGTGNSSTSVQVVCPSLSITKTTDAASVSAGSQIGSVVTLARASAATAAGLAVTDSLPSGTGVSWSIDGANRASGWSVTGSAPSQSPAYTPTTLAGNSSTHVHLVSQTTSASCKSYANTASFTS